MVEIEAAEHEGINFHFLAAPTRVIGDENGNVKQLEYLKMELGEPDASGRRRPVPVEGSETLMDIDMLITAIGQGPDVSFLEKEKTIKALRAKATLCTKLIARDRAVNATENETELWLINAWTSPFHRFAAS